MPSSPELTSRALDACQEINPLGSVADLAYRLVVAQGVGRGLYAGAKGIAKRARSAGVAIEDADTSAGNPLKILGAGPGAPLDWLLVSALVAHGAVRQLTCPEADSNRPSVARFVDSLVWLEANTKYEIWSFVLVLCPPSGQQVVAEALGRSIKSDDGHAASGDVAARSRNVVRLSLLRSLGEQAGGAVLSHLQDVLSDPCAAALCADHDQKAAGGCTAGPAATAEQISRPVEQPPAVGVEQAAPDGDCDLASHDQGAGTGGEPVVAGRIGRQRRGPVVVMLRVLTGWALLSAVGRLLRALLGIHASGSVTMDGQQVLISRAFHAFGLRYSVGDEMLPLATLLACERRISLPLLGPILGACVVFGTGLTAFSLGGTGLAAGVRQWVLLGGAFLLCGAAVDVLAMAVTQWLRGTVALTLRGPGVCLTLTGVSEPAAARFVRHLESRLADTL